MLQVRLCLPLINIKMNFSDNTVLTVKALNDFVKRIVDGNSYLSSVSIRGEISNFTNHYKSGHLYFTVKDDEAQIRCVMFSSYASKLEFRPADGMKVTVHGRVSMFVRDGQFIFYVDRLNADGVGDLYLKFELTKKKLADEGLFDSSKKKPLPKYPKRIGVITSDTGAAIQDIRNIITRRFPIAEIILYPSLVQGKDAESDLCRGIKYFSASSDVDVIIIGRGGGSIEDLWSFNSEKLARAIYACQIPVISAVGHETDFTICDFVSDLRAPTPSAAAELAVPDVKDLNRQLRNVVTKMQATLNSRISLLRLRLERSANHRLLQTPGSVIDDRRMHTERLRELLINSLQRSLERERNRINNAEARLNSDVKLIYEKRRSEYLRFTAKLDALNPLSVIARGYSAVFDENNKLIKSVMDVEIYDTLNIKLTDGTLTAKAVSKRRD